MKFYRGKFAIGIYSLEAEGETLLALCDNVREFAQLMGIKETCARVILQNMFTGKNKHIVFNKKFRMVEFIDMFV